MGTRKNRLIVNNSNNFQQNILIQLTAIKICSILNRRVFVMTMDLFLTTICCFALKSSSWANLQLLENVLGVQCMNYFPWDTNLSNGFLPNF